MERRRRSQGSPSEHPRLTEGWGWRCPGLAEGADVAVVEGAPWAVGVPSDQLPTGGTLSRAAAEGSWEAAGRPLRGRASHSSTRAFHASRQGTGARGRGS